MKLDASRPDVIFFLLWTVCALLVLFAPEELNVAFEPSFFYLIVFNIFSFFIVYGFIAAGYGHSSAPAQEPITEADATCLYRFIKICFMAWLLIYPVTVIYSGGMPIIWMMTGDGRTYVDFGVPSLSGALNLLRAFIFAGGVLLFLRRPGGKVFLILPAIMFISSFAELARGNMIVLVLHGIAMIAIMRPLRLKHVLRVGLALLCAIVLFGVIGDMRDEGRGILNTIGEDSIFSSLPSGFQWIYLYITTPINNVNYALAQGMEPLYAPFFSIQPMLPTVIRNMVFENQAYPMELVSEAFNATTFYSPLLSDFGMIGAAAVVVCLQIIVAYLHIRAKKGSVPHLLYYPAFYTSVVMSVFYMAFFSMTTVLYPLLGVGYMAFRKRYINKPVKCETMMTHCEIK